MENNFNLPEKAFVNKFIAKSKFYDKAVVNAKLQSEFINKIQKITWKYKLAEETIGIPKTDNVTEIQIFEIELKGQVIPTNVIKLIDKSVPYQILYMFIYTDSFAYAIALKKGNVASNYYFTEWNEVKYFSFTGINLEKVYENLIREFLRKETKQESSFADDVNLDNKIASLEKDIDILNKKVKNEKQFNRKVEINKILLQKKRILKELINQ